MPNTPNMKLPVSTVATSTGLQWEENVNSSMDIVDGHDHSPGSGVPINSNSLAISLDLPLNNNNLTLVRSVRFSPQISPLTDIGSIYESGVDLWFTDGNGVQIQITSSGSVNASSSGISNPPASASFVSGVLVVNAAANTPANIQGASFLLGNNVANSKYLTLSPPNSMSANYQLVLPSLPPAQQIMTLDASGNITAPYTVDNSTIVISSDVIEVPTSGITDTQIASQTITVDKLAPMALTASPVSLGDIMSISANFATTNTGGSYVFINSGTIVTGGRPLLIYLIPTSTNSPSSIQVGPPGPTFGGIQITVDGNPYQWEFGIPNIGGANTQMNMPASTVTLLVPVTAGTHTISVYAASFAGNVTINNTSLSAYEI